MMGDKEHVHEGMSDMAHILTVRYEVHDGDVTDQFLWPLGHTSIIEVCRARFVDGQWEVTSNDAAAPIAWVGHAEYKQEAILNYLKARLGHLHDTEKGQRRGE
jgi:hypothetical protein